MHPSFNSVTCSVFQSVTWLRGSGERVGWITTGQKIPLAHMLADGSCAVKPNGLEHRQVGYVGEWGGFLWRLWLYGFILLRAQEYGKGI